MGKKCWDKSPYSSSSKLFSFVSICVGAKIFNVFICVVWRPIIATPKEKTFMLKEKDFTAKEKLSQEKKKLRIKEKTFMLIEKTHNFLAILVK